MLSLVPPRVATRATVIPFQEPSVCPETDEEEYGFDHLEEMVSTHQTSSAVGWAFSSGSSCFSNENTYVSSNRNSVVHFTDVSHQIGQSYCSLLSRYIYIVVITFKI